MNTDEKEKELVSSRPKTPSKGIAAGAVFLFGGLVMEILAFSGALGGTTYYKDGVKTGFTPSAGWVLFGIVLIAVGSLIFYINNEKAYFCPQEGQGSVILEAGRAGKYSYHILLLKIPLLNIRL